MTAQFVIFSFIINDIILLFVPYSFILLFCNALYILKKKSGEKKFKSNQRWLGKCFPCSKTNKQTNNSHVPFAEIKISRHAFWPGQPKMSIGQWGNTKFTFWDIYHCKDINWLSNYINYSVENTILREIHSIKHEFSNVSKLRNVLWSVPIRLPVVYIHSLEKFSQNHILNGTVSKKHGLGMSNINTELTNLLFSIYCLVPHNFLCSILLHEKRGNPNQCYHLTICAVPHNFLWYPT